MTQKKEKKSGCLSGCLLDFVIISAILAGISWWLIDKDGLNATNLVSRIQEIPNIVLSKVPFLNKNTSPVSSQAPQSKDNPSAKNTLPKIPKTKDNSSAENSLSKAPKSQDNPSTENTLPKTPKTKDNSSAKNSLSEAPKLTDNSSAENSLSEAPKLEKKQPISLTPWEKKQIRGIYLSRYQITNNASEKTIRDRVRYYHSQGINTIIHGVWGNACTMYNSEVMEKTLGYKSCPNLFKDKWLDWLIDEAHKQNMEVHAYFEKGIKIDENSPIFDLAISRKWIVPGVDRTYGGIEHYVLDVEIPEVANFFRDIVVEFVKKYPQIDAVQWDDYLGYHAELPGKVDRTENLTNFVQTMISAMKAANPNVSFDICHHNPYWGKKYFAADWKNWDIDRAFIQAYNEKNFQAEVNYAENYNGIAITDRQLHRLPEILDNNKIQSILVFSLEGKAEKTASAIQKLIQKKN